LDMWPSLAVSVDRGWRRTEPFTRCCLLGRVCPHTDPRSQRGAAGMSSPGLTSPVGLAGYLDTAPSQHAHGTTSRRAQAALSSIVTVVAHVGLCYNSRVLCGAWAPGMAVLQALPHHVAPADYELYVALAVAAVSTRASSMEDGAASAMWPCSAAP
jgi:hypothetical protein